MAYLVVRAIYSTPVSWTSISVISSKTRREKLTEYERAHFNKAGTPNLERVRGVMPAFSRQEIASADLRDFGKYMKALKQR